MNIKKEYICVIPHGSELSEIVPFPVQGLTPESREGQALRRINNIRKISGLEPVKALPSRTQFVSVE